MLGDRGGAVGCDFDLDQMAVVVGICAALRRCLSHRAEIEVHGLERVLLEMLRVGLVFLAAEMRHPRRGRAVAWDPQAVDAGEIHVRHFHRREPARCRILVEHGQVHRHGQRGVKLNRRLVGIDIVGLGFVFQMIDQEDGVAFDAVHLGVGDDQHRGAVGAGGEKRSARDVAFLVGGRLQDRLARLVDDEAGIPAADIVAGAVQHVVAQREGLFAAVGERDHGLRARIGLRHFERIGGRRGRCEFDRFHLQRSRGLGLHRHDQGAAEHRHAAQQKSAYRHFVSPKMKLLAGYPPIKTLM